MTWTLDRNTDARLYFIMLNNFVHVYSPLPLLLLFYCYNNLINEYIYVRVSQCTVLMGYQWQCSLSHPNNTISISPLASLCVYIVYRSLKIRTDQHNVHLRLLDTCNSIFVQWSFNYLGFKASLRPRTGKNEKVLSLLESP